jgi:hypothetical protein
MSSFRTLLSRIGCIKDLREFFECPVIRFNSEEVDEYSLNNVPASQNDICENKVVQVKSA